jgi:maltose alpha-D-glucosyltransferase/alpha-amylase
MTASRSRDAAWYQEAVIYQLHVRTFADSDGDGIGDFRGAIGKLDYLKDLGVSCLWLLPFCESPLRDDGYDVSHYERIHPAYGTMADFEAFLAAAHDHGMRVITELVINHTSDRHPWFQAARKAPAGSAKRNFYVWSDTADRYSGARVIFNDVESSNWTWDEVAQAYYWHRFFSHQPDLNFDNPHVRQAVFKVMRFWFDKGVDGLRLDAIAHLFEREGTNCESLPETHAFLKDVRRAIDRQYPGRILLAEVNDTPDRTMAYFGDGDECHMAFHFPLMPRLFMAFAHGLAEPIVDIIERTKRLPDGCQWAIFLRNHDELTLSALGADERDWLETKYAPDPRMRLNRGIRRRLAPLLGNDDSRLLLASMLLLSLPGTPVLYYGDEIGMADDVELPDRDGLRTPMAWDAGDESPHTVADQLGRPASLLERVRRALDLRLRHPALRRGDTTFLDASNPHVLAFIRQHDNERVLVLANLAELPQTLRVGTPPGAFRSPRVLSDLIDPLADPILTTGELEVTLGPYGYLVLSVVAAVEFT